MILGCSDETFLFLVGAMPFLLSSLFRCAQKSPFGLYLLVGRARAACVDRFYLGGPSMLPHQVLRTGAGLSIGTYIVAWIRTSLLAARPFQWHHAIDRCAVSHECVYSLSPNSLLARAWEVHASFPRAIRVGVSDGAAEQQGNSAAGQHGAVTECDRVAPHGLAGFTVTGTGPA